ncbi:UPF0481 protein [Camellia lanceoleosa]|uniref:UPF0481 protein n=1 Tax=Camellia lanceoleosa TaxID=1840588 RepID=A0ACC0HFE2_9ERIC|nr:UPF0481 protein [Camellia lanceoleosa]
MSEPSADRVIDIDKKLDKKLHIDKRLAQLPPIASECCIFKVRDPLRNQSKEAYEPEVVVIGPYHHGEDKLKPMEDHKLRYLQQFLERNGTSVEKYIVAMRDSEKEARKFYADLISLDSNDFVEMMLLDSCFIIQLFHKFRNVELRKDDPIFQLEHIESSIRRDLMLFENQLPFSVLMKLSNMTQNPAASLNSFVYMSHEFFNGATPCELLEPPFGDLEKLEIKHLLGLLHYFCCHQFHSMVSQSNVPTEKKFLKSATELHEAGIEFKKVEERSLFNIKFENGTIEIPTLEELFHCLYELHGFPRELIRRCRNTESPWNYS